MGSPSRGRSDRGAATVETTGITVVAAVLVVALLTAVAPQARVMGETYGYWICKVVTFGQGSCDEPSEAADDREPTEPCVLATDGVERNQKIAVLVVTAEDGRRIEIARLSDGTYRVTTTDTRGAGLEVGVGGGLSVTVNDRTVGGAATAQAGVSLDVRSGQVYYADSDSMPGLLDALLQDQVKDAVVGEGPVRWVVDGIGGLVGYGAELPTPDEVYAQGGVSLNASAEATALTDSAAAGVSASSVLGTRVAKDGTVTVYVKNTVEGEAGLQSLGVDTDGVRFEGASLEGSIEVVNAVTFDEFGSMTSVQLTAVASGSSAGLASALFGDDPSPDLADQQGAARVYQATLDTTDPDNAEAANRYLLSVGVASLGAWTNPLASTVGGLGAADLMASALRDGTVTQQDYDTAGSTVFGIDASGKYGVELGVSASVREDSMTTTGARYWDGTQWADWEACSA